MDRRVLLSLVLVVTLGLVPMLVSAHGGGGTYRGYDMGPGMMGGMGHMGMMGGMGPLHMLDLSDEQRAKIRSIQENVRKQHWEVMGKIMDESSKLYDLFAADKPDAKKIGSVYGKIFDMKRQMIESSIDTHNQMKGVLTKEQHEQLEQMHGGRGWGMPGMTGPGMRRGGMMGH